MGATSSSLVNFNTALRCCMRTMVKIFRLVLDALCHRKPQILLGNVYALASVPPTKGSKSTQELQPRKQARLGRPYFFFYYSRPNQRRRKVKYSFRTLKRLLQQPQAPKFRSGSRKRCQTDSGPGPGAKAQRRRTQQLRPRRPKRTTTLSSVGQTYLQSRVSGFEIGITLQPPTDTHSRRFKRWDPSLARIPRKLWNELVSSVFTKTFCS